MIEVMLDDGVTPVALPVVTHCKNAKEAAETLKAGLERVATEHGGDVLQRSDGRNAHAVAWVGGPNQWADAYVVCDGADGKGFGSSADGEAVVFFNLD